MIEAALTPEQRLDEILSLWSAWCAERPEVVRPLLGGLTNKTYLIKSCGQHLVLRINALHSKALDLDRPAEVVVLKAAAHVGITPKLIYSDPAYRYMVTEFVVAAPWPPHYSNADTGLDKLAGLLRAIHGLEVAAPTLDNELKAERYWQAIDCGGVVPKQLLALSAKLNSAMQAAKAMNKSPCLCHNDLLPANLLLTAADHLYAIDWEYAALGDAYFDLAAVIEGHGLEGDSLQGDVLHRSGLEQDSLGGSSIEKLMLAYHHDNIESIDRRRLQLARVSFCYLDLLWYCAQSTLQATQGYNGLMDKKLSRLKRLLAIVV